MKFCAQPCCRRQANAEPKSQGIFSVSFSFRRDFVFFPKRYRPIGAMVKPQCCSVMPRPAFLTRIVARRRRRTWIQGASGSCQPARQRAPQAYSTVCRGARPDAMYRHLWPKQACRGFHVGCPYNQNLIKRIQALFLLNP
jgi:hypothetical protein